MQMNDKIMERYVKFICDELGTSTEVRLLMPSTYNGEPLKYIPKIGPTIYETVNLEVIETYTRSAKIRMKFDKYEIESIFYMSRKFGPEHILSMIEIKMIDIVNNAYIDDGRIEEIGKRYFEAKTNQSIAINKFIDKLKLNSNY